MSMLCALCLLTVPGAPNEAPASLLGEHAGLGAQRQLARPWAQVFGGGGADRAVDAAAAPSGGVYVAGTTFSFGGGASDGWVARVGATGSVRWEQALGGSGADELGSVAATPDGGCVLAGRTSSSGAGGTDGWVVKLAADGSVQWQKTFGTAADESFAAVAVSGSTSLTTRYYVGGVLDSGSSGREAWVLQLDAAGDPLWQESLGGRFDDAISALTATPGGVLLVAGSNSPLGGASVPFTRPWLVLLDTTGEPLAQRTFDFSGGDVLADVVALAGGGFALTGEILSFAFFRGDVWVLRLDQGLGVLWDRRFGDNSGNLFVDAGQRVREMPDGSLLVAGYTSTAGAGSDDQWILHLDAAGELLANRTLGDTGFDEGGGLVVAPSGDVYVAGFQQAPALGSLDVFLARLTPGSQLLGTATCPPTQAGVPSQWTSALTIGEPHVVPATTSVTPAAGGGVTTPLASGAFLCR